MAIWLVKSEPTEYSIDDLKKEGVGQWDGVRNYQARNFLMDMKPGDTILFYHSSCETPGIVGEAKVAKKAYPDRTQFQPSSEYYDPKSDKTNPRWFGPDVRFVKKFNRTVTLSELRADKDCKGMMLLRKGNRLSVMPIMPKEKHAIEKLASK